MGPDERWMRVALEEARRALEHDDVPIGCVIVSGDDTELARTHNARERDADPTAHAELVALREAAARVGSWRLDGCTLYVTLEPCAMCSGALVLARVERLVYGATDPKAGASGSLYDIPNDERLNHRIHVTRGVLGEESSTLLKDFFMNKRHSAPSL